ncbi:MAG: 50S ribosomal protein L21 [Candidatus Buchananbacteria bacterium]
MKLAVIKTGGKQYIVQEGQLLVVEKLLAKVGEVVDLPALLIGEGDNLELGKPILATKIKATIIEQQKADKVVIIKYKPKVRYRKKQGHRQRQTQIKIGKI